MSPNKTEGKTPARSWVMLTLILLMTGMPVAAQDTAQIVELAEQGEPVAQNKLGIMYASGNGMLKDFKKAFELFEKSANQGLPGAQYNLGRLYQNGLGVKQDDVVAASWYQRAAEGGDAMAQYNLGFMYAKGVGVQHDPKAAFLWISKAADQGLPIAQQAIARLNSIKQDLQQAETQPITPESMAAIVRADSSDQKSRTSAEKPSSEEEKRKAETLARIRQKKASANSSQTSGNTDDRKAGSSAGEPAGMTTADARQNRQTPPNDRKIWLALSGLLIIPGVYWLYRSRKAANLKT